MVDTSISAALTIRVIDDVSAPARSIEQALGDVAHKVKDVAAGLAGTGASDRLQKSLVALGATKGEIEGVAKAWKGYAASAGLAADATEWTKAQAAGEREWVRQTVGAIREVRREQNAFHEAQKRALAPPPEMTEGLQKTLAALGATRAEIEQVSNAWRAYAASAGIAADATRWTREQAADVRAWEEQTVDAIRTVRRERNAYYATEKRAMAAPLPGARREAVASGPSIAMGIAGAYTAAETADFAKSSLELYREFDKERRFGKAVMGLSDADQEPLVRQAITLGGATKFNDVQVLEAQRTLAARGLSKDQILGMMPNAADLGQALDLSLPDAVKQLEGAIFGFKKPIGTLDEAVASAKETADRQVKAAKIGGLEPEDISQAYKYGATPARLSGVSEGTLLGFAAIAKRSNMGGDESGVAFRALMAAATSPTSGARTALRAAGLNYRDYQRAPTSIAVAPFVGDVAERYGVKLNGAAQKSLATLFSNPALLGDPAKFMPAVMGVLGGALGGADAKSKKSIAGEAMRYLKASMEGVDVNALMVDLMKKLPGNLQLANAIFGSKQGGRIASALGDPEVFKKMIDLITNHSEGFAGDVADQRMAGFDGAMSRLEGSIKNLETSFGRSVDDNGAGGALTGVVNSAGRVIQAFAEMSPRVIRTAAEVGALGATFAGLKGVESLMGGFGLKTSAVALTGAAEALTASAGRIAVGGALGSGAGAAVGAAEGVAEGAVVGLGARLLSMSGYAALAAMAIVAADEALGAFAPNVQKSIHDAVAGAVVATVQTVRNAFVTPLPSSPVADRDDRRAIADQIAYEQRQKAIRDGKEGLVHDITTPLDAEKRNIVAGVDRWMHPSPDGAKAATLPAEVEILWNADKGDRRTLYHDDLEREREARRAGAMSTPAADAHAPNRPNVDASGVAALKTEAEGGKVALDALNATVKPMVDVSSISQARSELAAFLADLRLANSLMSGLPGSVSTRLPELGKASRGSFSHTRLDGS